MSEPIIKETTCFSPETVIFLLGLSKERASGTFTAPTVEASDKRIVFSINQGHIRDITFPGQSTLEQAFKDILSNSELKKAKKISAKQKISVGEAILNRGSIEEDQAIDAVLSFVSNSFGDLLTLKAEEILFTPSDQADIYLSDLGSNYEIHLAIDELLLNALAEFEAWDFVVENFSALRDVYYATPSAVKYFNDQSQYQDELAILQAADGRNDVEEAINAAGLEPFFSLRIFQKLAEDGVIELVNPVQLFQLGLEAEEDNNWIKALRLYQRALDRGLDDFDLQFRLAHAFEKTGRKNTAISRYLDFADKCAKEFRFEDTLNALKQITKLDQNNIPIRRRYIQLLNKYDKKTEAAEEAIKLSETLSENNRNEEAKRILSDAVEQCSENSVLQEKYINLCEKCDAEEELKEAKQKLTRINSEREDSSQVLEYFQKLFVEGEDTLEVRLKLVELHIVQNNREKALDHLEALLAPGNPYGISDLEQLRSLHKKRCRLRPGDRYSAWFLIEDALALKDINTAEKYLRQLVAHLNPDNDINELITALKRLVKVFPEKHEYHWQLTQEFEKAGKKDKAIETLWKILEIENKAGNLKDARRAMDEILLLSPFDRDAREELIRILGLLDQKEDWQRERKHLAVLRLIAGEIDQVQSLCREIVNDNRQDAYLLVMLAELCSKTGDTKMAGDQYVRAGKILLKEYNIGLAKLCVQKLQELGTHSNGTKDLEREIKNALAATSAQGIENQGGRDNGNNEGYEPFCHMKKRVLQKSVNSITARLKNVKIGGKSKNGGTAKPFVSQGKNSPGGKTVKGGVSSSINKLKSLGVRAAGKRSKPIDNNEQPDQPQSSQAGSSDNMDKNKSQAKEQRKPVKLNGAAARLKALKSGGKSSKTNSDIVTKTGPEAGTVSEPEVKDHVSPEASKQMNLGSAASRLAKLRQV